MKRTLIFCILVAVAAFALASPIARADEITVAGMTSSSTPNGITFTPGNFNQTTSGGFAQLNLGSYTLTNTGNYTGTTVDLTVVFTLPAAIAGGSSTSFTANVFGNVTTTSGGGVQINFTNPSQTFTFSNANGSGTFTFNVNSLSVPLGGASALTGYVSNASFTPVPEPSSILLLGAGLLLLGAKRSFARG